MQLLLPLQKSKSEFPKETNLCCELGCSNLSQIEVINEKIVFLILYNLFYFKYLIQVLFMRTIQLTLKSD